MSYRLSDAFMTASERVNPLITCVTLTATAGIYVFHSGNLNAVNLPSGNVVDTSAALVGMSGLTETLLSNVTDIFGNYTSTEQTECQITLNDVNQQFAVYLSNDTFLGSVCVVKIGYPELAYIDMLTLFSGTVSNESINDGQLQIQATADGSILRQSHITGRASRYARPKNSDDVLPIVYGGHLDYARGRGKWVCPCIDTTNQYYLVADHAVLSVANGNTIRVWVDDTLKTTGYTFTPSGTDENGRTIAYLTFSPALADSVTVTVQCQGKIDSGGLLIQNPIAIIQDIVTYAGGTTADFDAYNIVQESAYATSKNLMAAGILTHQSRLVQELVLEVLGSFLASSWVSGQDDVKISFLRDTVSQSDIALFLSEATCSEYTTERMRENLCNSTTFDLVKDAAHDGYIYPNWSPYNIDCDADAGTQYNITDAGDTWMLTSDGATAGNASLWIADPKTGITTRYNYTASANWVAQKYFQLPNGNRKRLLWSNALTGAAVVWELTNSYTVGTVYAMGTLGASWGCFGYWHDGTTGISVRGNTATNETRLYVLNSSDAEGAYSGWTIAGYLPVQYSRPQSNRIRLALRRTADNLFSVWTLNSSNVYVSNKDFTIYSGFRPRSYWHNGTDGKLVYANATTGAPYQRILDANDTDIANVADVSGASAIATSKLSQSRDGVQPRAFDGGWMSSTQTPFAVQRALYNQYAQPRWIVSMTTTDLRAMQLERGDLIAYSCDQLRDENALPLVNQIGRVLELTRDPIAGTCQLRVLDTGSYYTGSGTTRDRTRY